MSALLFVWTREHQWHGRILGLRCILHVRGIAGDREGLTVSYPCLMHSLSVHQIGARPVDVIRLGSPLLPNRGTIQRVDKPASPLCLFNDIYG